jgi:hypothetical protein
VFKKGFIIFSVFLHVSLLAFGQQPVPKGSFLEDSLKIGQPVRYTLSMQYPEEMDIVFPDSLYNFAPFELSRKEYFPTRTQAGISYDSAIYYLMSFEIDTVQILTLPIYRLTLEDSIPMMPPADTIYLQQLVTEIPDSVALEAMPLLENTDYLQVDYEFNYPYFFIGLTIFVIVAFGIFIFYGKSIHNKIKAYRLQKRHNRFLTRFDLLTAEEPKDLPKHAEEVVVVWKEYLEKLEPWPYRTLTTRELLTTAHAPELEHAMHSIDRAIYSPSADSVPPQSYNALRDFAEKRFDIKLNQLKHG